MPVDAPLKIPPPKRWDNPFDPNMSDQDVERILAIDPFNRVDQNKFKPPRTLSALLKNDARIIKFRNGDIVVRDGEYDNNSVFFVLSGNVRLMINQGLPRSMLGQEPSRPIKSVLEALSQLWSNHKGVEVRSPEDYMDVGDLGMRGESEGFNAYIHDVSAIIDQYQPIQLGVGDLFGVVSALTRSPREMTVFVEGEAELVEIRWQGIRDIRVHAQEIRDNMDHLYRQTSLNKHLKETKLFQHLDAETLNKVAEQTLFETHGDYDWHISYKKLIGESAAKRLEHEPVIAEEGGYVDGLILVRAGFARVSVRAGHGHHTLRFLGHGDTFGFEEVAHNWKARDRTPMRYSLRTIGYTDVLRVPTALVETHVLPYFEEHGLLPEPIETKASGAAVGLNTQPNKISQDMLEFFVEERFINGTATMIIDVDRCTGCDDCVRACAATHDNNPRFVRHGPVHEHYMVPNACMQCVDPVCLIGCPTGAIHRDPRGGEVVINDLTCVGCSTCANSCPYDNIRMVHVNDDKGTQIINQSTFSPILKATKCDLCVDQRPGVSPACERACPHDALRRVDMRDLDASVDLLSR